MIRLRFSSVLLLFLVVACAAPRPLAVPEYILSLRENLPLNEVTRARVVDFIAAGGQQRTGGTGATPIPAVERDFGRVLDLLTEPDNLRFNEFERRLSAIGPLGDRERPIIDAREEYPDELGRVAYLLHNFWFVLYAKKESPDGNPLPAEQWTFTRLTLFRDRPPK